MIQSLYIALSHISIRTHNKLSARVIKYAVPHDVSPHKEGLDPLYTPHLQRTRPPL